MGIKQVDILNISLIILATLGARNIGFIFNRWIDRDIDLKILEPAREKFHLVKLEKNS